MPAYANSYDTHAVFNQVAPFQDVNLFAADVALQEGVRREGATAALPALSALGQRLGRAETQELARLANLHGPQLHNFDRYGERIDEVEFHPAWHALMTLLIEAGAHSAPWEEGAASGAQVARAAAYLLFGQVENGSQCPVTMTYASVAALRLAPQLAQRWLPKILSRHYDPRSLPIEQKRGLLIGMGMTEKQGGSDVRSNTTRAVPVPAAEAARLFGAQGEQAGTEGLYRIVGHKWFFSAPQSDAHLILAQTGADADADADADAGARADAGTGADQAHAGGAALSCLLVPRFLPDGQRNQIRVQRLKDKLGNRSNASSEVEFTGAYGWLVGPAGRGIPTILAMGGHTRLDCVLGSAGIMRAALTQALHHARGRLAFGRALAEQPLMMNVLADLALESEAATAFALRLARCFDEAATDPAQALLGRLLTPAGKYWICKRAPGMVAEAMEVLGGSGYVEDGPLARLYREAPVNSIWEGSGNIMCLDLLRAVARTPSARQALADELALAGEAQPQSAAHAAHADFAAYAEHLLADLAQPQDEYAARRLAERVVLAVQAALLLRHSPAFVSSAFVRSRLAQGGAGAYGGLPDGVDCAAILARALVAPAAA